MSTPNTTPLTYNGYVTQIATMAVVNTTVSNSVVVGVDPSFNAIIPQMLNYAELRIQRDADLLPLLTSNSSYSLSQGNNILQVSVNDFVTIQTVSVLNGTASSPLLPTTKEFLQNCYNDSSSSYWGTPQYFAMYGGDSSTGGNTYQNIVIGPYPDQTYQVLMTGTIRMPSLYEFATAAYAGTSTTFISTYLPDLLIMASMIYISAFQRNFGRQSDDPGMAQSYESQYQALLKGAITEEYRKKMQAAAWSSTSSSPVATPTRG
jgi:hypothetical protein